MLHETTKKHSPSNHKHLSDTFYIIISIITNFLLLSTLRDCQVSSKGAEIIVEMGSGQINPNYAKVHQVLHQILQPMMRQ